MKSLYTDGGARGNPGPGAFGVVIKNEDGSIFYEMGAFLGVCTNNDAEYRALIHGLKTALEKNIQELSCYLDSELVVKQMEGNYKVKNERLKGYFVEAKSLSDKFTAITFNHIPREKNHRADALVNKVLDALMINE